jgi:hypothetical protein
MQMPDRRSQSVHLPTGRWHGCFTQPSVVAYPVPMEIQLACFAGLIQGEGRDAVGSFHIEGTIDPETNSVEFEKAYCGSHIVRCAGWYDPQSGTLGGLWRIRHDEHDDNGGWRLWPVDRDPPAAAN